MSGGRWEFAGFRVGDELETIAQDEDVRTRWPLVGSAIQFFADWIQRVEHDMDWDISSDSTIEDDAAFDRAEFARLLDALLKAAPGKCFRNEAQFCISKEEDDDTRLSAMQERADRIKLVSFRGEKKKLCMPCM